MQNFLWSGVSLPWHHIIVTKHCQSNNSHPSDLYHRCGNIHPFLPFGWCLCALRIGETSFAPSGALGIGNFHPKYHSFRSFNLNTFAHRRIFPAQVWFCFSLVLGLPRTLRWRDVVFVVLESPFNFNDSVPMDHNHRGEKEEEKDERQSGSWVEDSLRRKTWITKSIHLSLSLMLSGT